MFQTGGEGFFFNFFFFCPQPARSFRQEVSLALASAGSKRINNQLYLLETPQVPSLFFNDAFILEVLYRLYGEQESGRH